MTWTWIVIALAFAAGLVAYSARKKRNPLNDAESTQGTAQSTDQTAEAGTDSEDRASSSVMQPSPDGETGQPDPARHLATASLSAELGDDPGTGGQPYAQLLETREMEPILGQWKDIQAEFVDEPRKAVQDADALVADLMERLAQMFATEREQLESQWAGGDDVSTEDLRRSLRRYRSFVEQPYAQLLETREMEPILRQWKDIQAEFVDEPRKAVQDADTLVADLMERLAQTFATEREQLESQSAGGDDVSMEDLRRSLRRYRSFFERLLAA
jgi:DNA-binding ferritin-like protein